MSMQEGLIHGITCRPRMTSIAPCLGRRAPSEVPIVFMIFQWNCPLKNDEILGLRIIPIGIHTFKLCCIKVTVFITTLQCTSK